MWAIAAPCFSCSLPPPSPPILTVSWSLPTGSATGPFTVAPWEARYALTSIVFLEEVWMMGGIDEDQNV